MHPDDPILATSLAGLPLRSPLILAAGTAGYLDEMREVLDLSRIGAVVTKSITAEPRDGNPTWRIIESRSGGGMLNAIGLANVGLERFLEHFAPRLASAPTTIIGSIAGFSIDGYVRVAAAMNEIDAIPAVELNVSCPNVHGGVEFGVDPAAMKELTREVRRVLTRTRLFIKLSPIAVGSPSIVDIARAAIDPGGEPAGPNSRPGADALSIANTVPAMAIDPETRRPRLANVTGGLSGPAIHPIAVRLVHEVYRKAAKDTSTPLIGIGGVMRWEDAAEFILAGASAFEMGTALFADPRSPSRVTRGLTAWARRQGVRSISELVGAVSL
ncbi:MAG: dihydroorotate dehydrogenase [Phycisphaerales bacterium]|nr:dihydroorotate dehydrogenase [Phycisphaerales bacterium]